MFQHSFFTRLVTSLQFCPMSPTPHTFILSPSFPMVSFLLKVKREIALGFYCFGEFVIYLLCAFISRIWERSFCVNPSPSNFTQPDILKIHPHSSGLHHFLLPYGWVVVYTWIYKFSCIYLYKYKYTPEFLFPVIYS